MRPGLLFRDRDLALGALAEPDPDLVADLGLGTLFGAMARGDRDLAEVARRVVPAGLATVDDIAYRQAVVRDALAAPAMVRDLHAIAVDAIDAERRVWGGSLRNAELVLDRAAEVLGLFLESFRALRRLELAYGATVTSPGFRAFFASVASEFDDAFLAAAEEHVARLRTRTLHVGARLGPGNRGTGYVLHRPSSGVRSWRDRIGLEDRRFTVTALLRDQNQMNMVTELRSVAVAPTAAVVHDAARQVLGFFRLLRAEAGFLVGCVNLDEALAAHGAPRCFPEAADGEPPVCSATGLYDPSLRLTIDGPVVGNDVRADGRRVVVVTGSNGGGKSTLVRAVGIAQLMLQAGMFVAAEAFSASLRTNVLTHFTREEDASLERGKLHEELARLGALVDAAAPGSLVLLNETLSSAHEREGAEIARQVVTALADSGVRVWYVTHNHEFAAALHRAAPPWAHFLRAERGADGARSFRVVEAPPLPTSHGMDLYRRVVRQT